jgi:hypothetical protein
MNMIVIIAVIVMIVICNTILMWRTSWAHRELKQSLEREKRAYGNNKNLLASLNATTASLKRQNDMVRRLLAEKRAAWSAVS